ncbi:hypothetical protein Q427_01505 [Halomonas sp. BC04]|nr:hypothetical protein Q427_01505 [Halomonas sp. BC04]
MQIGINFNLTLRCKHTKTNSRISNIQWGNITRSELLNSCFKLIYLEIRCLIDKVGYFILPKAIQVRFYEPMVSCGLMPHEIGCRREVTCCCSSAHCLNFNLRAGKASNRHCLRVKTGSMHLALESDI